jgi:ATP-dependent exoDNAse (exonuclease V) beta subunit
LPETVRAMLREEEAAWAGAASRSREGPDREPAGDDVGAAAEIIQQVIEIFTGMREQPDVRAVLGAGESLYEVPFSLRVDRTAADARWPGIVTAEPKSADVVVRGVIDCLVQRPDDSVVVVDFKTGAPTLPDRAQLQIYLAAARGLFPGRPVHGRLVYRDHTVTVSSEDGAV